MRGKPAALALREEVISLKRERIIEAAVRLFYEHGFENTTLDAVADELGVRKPFIYSYFESKADLLAKICERGVAEALAAMIEVLNAEGRPTEKLRKISEAMVQAVIKNQKHNAIWAREEKNLLPKHSEQINKIRREFDRKLDQLLEKGCKTGEFTIPDTRIATLAIGGMGTWVHVWYRENGRLSPQEIASRLTDLILTMVKAKVPLSVVAPNRSRK